MVENLEWYKWITILYYWQEFGYFFVFNNSYCRSWADWFDCKMDRICCSDKFAGSFGMSAIFRWSLKNLTILSAEINEFGTGILKDSDVFVSTVIIVVIIDLEVNGYHSFVKSCTVITWTGHTRLFSCVLPTINVALSAVILTI